MRQVALWGTIAAAIWAAMPVGLEAQSSVSDPAFLEDPTEILSQRDADRLLSPGGITLQWIGWDDRGPVSIAPDERGVWHVSGHQTGSDGGELEVDGTILEIGEEYFTLHRTIAITRYGARMPCGQDLAFRDHAEPPLLPATRIRVVRSSDRLRRYLFLK